MLVIDIIIIAGFIIATCISAFKYDKDIVCKMCIIAIPMLIGVPIALIIGINDNYNNTQIVSAIVFGLQLIWLPFPLLMGDKFLQSDAMAQRAKDQEFKNKQKLEEFFESNGHSHPEPIIEMLRDYHPIRSDGKISFSHAEQWLHQETKNKLTEMSDQELSNILNKNINELPVKKYPESEYLTVQLMQNMQNSVHESIRRYIVILYILSSFGFDLTNDEIEEFKNAGQPYNTREFADLINAKYILEDEGSD